MSYGTSRRGDYLGAYRGDPGFFKKLLKGVGKLAGVFLGGGAAPAPTRIIIQQPRYQQAGMLSLGGPRGLVIRDTPARARGVPSALRASGPYISPSSAAIIAAGGVPPRRKRMNVANPKALRRAIRRQAGFVKLAKRALKGSGYTVVSKGSRRPQRAVRITESGPGSVNVR